MAGKLDLIIFGASGYTGRFVIPEMFRIGQKYPDIKWAIAGRSEGKLRDALEAAAKDTGANTSSIKIITADAKNEDSLRAMCLQCKVVMNCAGPFLTCGETLVRTAIQCKTDYLDVCSELPFIKKVFAKYDYAAQKNGVYVINACGLGCVPADLGVVFMQQQFQGTLHSVEAYLTTQPQKLKSRPSNFIRDSTWEAIVDATAKKPICGQAQHVEFEPELKTRPFVHKRFDRWCVPYPGAEESVVKKTQEILKPYCPVQFKRYHSLPSLFTSLSSAIGGYILLFLLKIPFMASLFIKYPKFFSLGLVTYGDPDEKVMEQLTFNYEMVGVGWRGKIQGEPRDEIIAKVYPFGKKNAPYEGTAVAAIYCALTMLTERHNMPKECGVLTPGAAFRDTSIIEKLNNDNIKFEIVKQ